MIEVDMGMPKSCYQCPLSAVSLLGRVCNAKKYPIDNSFSRPLWCPLRQQDEDDLK